MIWVMVTLTEKMHCYWWFIYTMGEQVGVSMDSTNQSIGNDVSHYSSMFLVFWITLGWYLILASVWGKWYAWWLFLLILAFVSYFETKDKCHASHWGCDLDTMDDLDTMSTFQKVTNGNPKFASNIQLAKPMYISLVMENIINLIIFHKDVHL